MSEQKDSFVFYRGFREAIKKLPRESRLIVMDYLINYALDGVEPEESENVMEEALFFAFKPQIDAAQKRYETAKKNGSQAKNKNNEASNKQNEASNKQNEANAKQNEANNKQNEANANLNDNVNVNDNVNDNINDNDNPPKGEVQKGESLPPDPLGENDKNSIRQELKKIRDSFVFPSALQKKVNDWLMYKKEKRQPYKPKGLHSLLSQIQNRCSQYGEQAVMDVIDISMANNYEGILWAKIAEGKKGQVYGTDYRNYGANADSETEPKSKPQQYGDVL